MAGCENEVEDAESKLESKEDKNDHSEWVESQLRLVGQQLEEVQSNCNDLQESFFSSMDQFKQLLEFREKLYMTTIASIKESKVAALTLYKESLEAIRGRELTSGGDKAAELQPPLPTLQGGVSCGFSPDFSALTLATTSLITTHATEVSVGGSVRVSVVGSMSSEGFFWVRLLPGELRIEDIILQNISNSLQAQLEQSFAPLSSPQPGTWCAARYSEDQRWYRGRVVSTPKRNMVSVFFIDFGNTEDFPASSLHVAPLGDGYLVFPPQMIRCCFTTDHAPISREAKWKFADLTHNQELVAHLLQEVPLSVEEGGKGYIIRLIDESPGQPFDLGVTVMALASVSQSSQGAISCRDVRYKNKPLPPNARQTISGRGVDTPSQSQEKPSDTPSQSQEKPSDTTPSQSQEKPPDTPSQPQEKPPDTPSQSQEKPSDTPSQPQEKPSDTPSQPQEKPPDTPSQSQEKPSDTPSQPQEKPPDTPSQSQEKPPDTPSQSPAQSTDNAKELVCSEDGRANVPAVSDSPPSSETVPVSDPALSNELSPPHVSEPPATSGTGREGGSPVGGSLTVQHTDTESGSSKVTPETSKRVSGDGSKPPVLIKPLTIKSEKADSKEQIPILNGELKNCLTTLNPKVKTDARLTVYVTTDLSKDGSFWAHMGASDAHEAMFKQLQLTTSRRKEEYTPVFFGVGDLCTAQFSEDEGWYRARIEEIVDEEFLVRYLDFGNIEARPLPLLAPLSGAFLSLPALALKCSLACEDHLAFTQSEVDKFSELVTEDPLSAQVLEIDDDTVKVQLSIKIRGVAIDVNEEVYLADTSKKIESMSFSLASTGKSVPPLTIQDTTSMVTSWADQMDELASPVGDGLTLSGVGGERFTSPSPTPQEGQRSKEPSRPQGHHTSVEVAKPIEIMKRPNTHTNPRSSPSNRAQPSRPPHSTSPHVPSTSSARDRSARLRPAPRLDMSSVNNSILRSLGNGRGTPIGSRERRATAPPGTRQKSPPTQVTPSQLKSSVRNTRSPSPRGGYGRGSDEIVQLFVKNIPDNKKKSYVVDLFSHYGTVRDVQMSKDRATVCYVTMTAQDAENTITALHGKPLNRHSNPLFIELTHHRR